MRRIFSGILLNCLFCLAIIPGLSSCAFSSKTCKILLEKSLKKDYDIVVVPGAPFTNGQWSPAVKARVYWSKFLYDKGIAKNVMYSGSAVYTPYYEAEIMALYAEKIGIPKENIFVETRAQHSTENIYYSYKKARLLGFKRIALASDPFQTKMLKRFTRKLVNSEVALIPIVTDTLRAMEPNMINPEIDYNKAFVRNFKPLPERQNFLKRFRGTRGLDLDTNAYSAVIDPRTTINLNGTWDFEQTADAFPPKIFSRKIPVPGLITLAEPRIADYDRFVKRPGKVIAKEQHNLYEVDYSPRYSWYRKTVYVDRGLEGSEVTISLKKSQYVTQVFINGIDLGTSMACYTPIDCRATQAIKFGSMNEILIRIGDRIWLPSEAAGGTDKEKEHYLPGIWDDVLLSFTSTMRINRLLLLPSVSDKKVTIKAQIRNFNPAQIFYGDPMSDSVRMSVVLKEAKSGSVVMQSSRNYLTRRDNLTEVCMDIPLSEFKVWSPEDPFLYKAEVTLFSSTHASDQMVSSFGMRDFIRRGKYFYLNGNQYVLRGTNVTLQRFFEDPDSRNLVWNKEWVKKFLIDYPKQLNWNAMRICVGIVPDFWYDLADEYGLVFQNEWLYWQNHGWDEEIRKEYTDWVWSDGSHPSIVIWDAINENWDDYIGNSLIPELKKLDPTRIWDAGYMTSERMQQDEIDEVHPYQGPWNQSITEFEKNPYPLGDLDFRPDVIQVAERSSSAQLVNEYGWIWLWRNGLPSKLTVDVFNYYLGSNSTPLQNRELQAYWLQLETEWLRSNTSLAGVLAFCYLANNYGYTGDWFIDDIRDLKPGITLQWFRHCFAPAAVFIDLADERYMKQAKPHKPGSNLEFSLIGVNNNPQRVSGQVKIRMLNEDGKQVGESISNVVLAPHDRSVYPSKIILPDTPGGYLLLAEFTPAGALQPIISRRYLKIGNQAITKFFELQARQLE